MRFSTAKARITMRAELVQDRLLVDVQDEGNGSPAIRECRSEGGPPWGLKIVDAAASRWGVQEGTTHVWFEMELPGPRIGPKRTRNSVAHDQRHAPAAT